MNEKEKMKLKEKVKQLEKMKGKGTELISLYIPQDHNINQEVTRLKTEYSEAANIKSKSTRKHVQSAIKTILQSLKGVKKIPENGVAIFAGYIDGNMKKEIISPPEPIQVNLYNCDNAFDLEELKGLIESKEIYGLVTIDSKNAAIAKLKGKHLEIIQSFGSQVPSKHTKGGWSQRRFERIINEAKHEHYKKAAGIINKEFQEDKVKGVIIGGPGQAKDKIDSDKYLNKKIRNKILGKPSTGYADESGIRELMEKSEDLIKDLEVQKERETIDRFMKKVTGNELATYGLREVVKALRRGKVETLLISEDLKWVKTKIKCPGCGKEEMEVIKNMDEFEEQGKICSNCEEEREIIEKKEISEELEELAEQIGAEVKYVSTDTDKGNQFYEAFGGIGAILRYK
ncbi:MAG: peptide chain release factor aRF-1 [archaeon]